MQDFVTPDANYPGFWTPLPFEFTCTHVWVNANMHTYLSILFPLWGYSLIIGWVHKSGRRSNIFGSYLVDQQVLNLLGGGNLCHISCWGICWSWYVFKWIHMPIWRTTNSRLLRVIRNICAQLCGGSKNIHASCWATCLLHPPHN